MLLLIVFFVHLSQRTCLLWQYYPYTLAKILQLTCFHYFPLTPCSTKLNNMNVCTHRIFLYLILTPNVTIYIIPSSITPVMRSYSFSCFFVLSIYCYVCEIVCVFILLKRGIFNCLKWYVKLHSKIGLFHFAPLSGSTHCNVS